MQNSITFLVPDKLVLANKASSVTLVYNFKYKFIDYKGTADINYTIVKYGKTFYGRHTALASAVVKIDKCYPEMPQS